MAVTAKRVNRKHSAGPRAPRYRRSPFLVSYWKESLLLFENYLSGKVVSASAETTQVLDFFDEWQTVGAMSRRWPQYNAKSLRATVRQLTRQTLLETSRDNFPEHRQKVAALKKWKAWNPAASFFHLSTKDVYSDEIADEELSYIQKLMEKHPLPRPAKNYPGARVVKLHSKNSSSEFSRVLLQRRTWRKFSPHNLSRESFSSLMELSFGVQQWQAIPKAGKLAQKTSPSGGSLHPLEAYVVVRRVEGIAPGIYHYDAIGRRLQELRKGATSSEFQKLLAGQWWFQGAALVVFLTAIFSRTQWKYDYARAYRAILIEAGHLCQTFCLTATWLGLAPFCTIAMKDTAIEKALKVDGISESVIYAMGAGLRPGEN